MRTRKVAEEGQKRRRKGMEEQAVDEEGTTYKAGAFSTTFSKIFFWVGGWKCAVFEQNLPSKVAQI